MFFIEQYPLVKPVVTPRFAPSCTGDLLGQLGEIAKNNKLHIQVSTLWQPTPCLVLNNKINTCVVHLKLEHSK